MRIAVLASVVCSVVALPVGAQAKWKLTEEWRIGGADSGALPFTNVRALAVFPDGRLAVLDGNDFTVHILDAHGRVMRSVGGAGSGPDQFRDPRGLAISPSGQIVVYDARAARFSVFAPSGDLVRTIPVRVDAFGGPWDAFFNSTGHLSERVFVRPQNGERHPPYARRVWSTDFTRADTVTASFLECESRAVVDSMPLSYGLKTQTGGMVMSIPFAEPHPSLADAHDGTIWVGMPPFFDVIRKRPVGSCDPSRDLQLRGPAVTIPGNVRDSARNAVMEIAEKAHAEQPDLELIPRTYPYYQALYVDDVNRLWVQRMSADGHSRFEIYSVAGTRIAELDVPVGVSWPVVIKGDRVYTFSTGANGVPYLFSFRVSAVLE